MKLSDRIRIAIPAACLILASLCSGGEMTPAQRENYIERLNAGHWKLELAMRSGNPSHVTLAQQASQQTASELPPGPEDGGDVESQFSRFYQQKVWGNDGGGSGSSVSTPRSLAEVTPTGIAVRHRSESTILMSRTATVAQHSRLRLFVAFKIDNRL